MEYYSAAKKNEILSFATIWIVRDIMLHEISKTEKDECHMSSLVYGVLKK